MPRALHAVALVALAAGAAHASDLSIGQQAVILLRALAYDRDLGAGAGGTVDVVVLARSNGDGAYPAFKALEKNTVAGLPVRVRRVPFTTVDALRAGLAGVDVLYLPAGLDNELEGIVAAAREAHVTTLASERSYLEKGAGVGVFMVADRPTIFVNVAAAKAEGAAFSSELFKIARPVR